MSGSAQPVQLHVQAGRSVADRQFHKDFARSASPHSVLSDLTHVSSSSAACEKHNSHKNDRTNNADFISETAGRSSCMQL